jgi:hypothetical protein
MSETEQYSGAKGKLIGAWLFVGVPLAYGIVVTVQKSIPLFTGG